MRRVWLSWEFYYDQMMEGKDKPETEGYTTEDFYKLLNARISAETAVLEARK